MSRWHGSGRESLGEFTWSGNPSRGMKAKKRLEAEERNAATPYERTQAYRRQLEAAATTKKRSKTKAGA